MLPDDLDDVILEDALAEMKMISNARNIADQASSYLITATGQPSAASLIFASSGE
jgi:hypothetical protein